VRSAVSKAGRQIWSQPNAADALCRAVRVTIRAYVEARAPRSEQAKHARSSEGGRAPPKQIVQAELRQRGEYSKPGRQLLAWLIDACAVEELPREA